jgi:hypothetical protein
MRLLVRMLAGPPLTRRAPDCTCHEPLRDPAGIDELRTHQAVLWLSICVNDWRRRRFSELPSWCLVTARETLEVHTRLLELQQAIVPVEAAVRLTDSIEHGHGFSSSRQVGSFSR